MGKVANRRRVLDTHDGAPHTRLDRRGALLNARGVWFGMVYKREGKLAER